MPEEPEEPADSRDPTSDDRNSDGVAADESGSDRTDGRDRSSEDGGEDATAADEERDGSAVAEDGQGSAAVEDGEGPSAEGDRDSAGSDADGDDTDAADDITDAGADAVDAERDAEVIDPTADPDEDHTDTADPDVADTEAGDTEAAVVDEREFDESDAEEGDYQRIREIGDHDDPYGTSENVSSDDDRSDDSSQRDDASSNADEVAETDTGPASADDSPEDRSPPDETDESDRHASSDAGSSETDVGTEADDDAEPVDDSAGEDEESAGEDEESAGEDEESDTTDDDAEPDEDDSSADEGAEPDDESSESSSSRAAGGSSSTDDATSSGGPTSTREKRATAPTDSDPYDRHRPRRPPDDEEMPLTEHIEEMLTRLAIVIGAAGIVALAVFPWANDVIIHMWYDVHTGTVAECLQTPQAEGCAPPHVYGPLELVLTRIRVAGLAGLVMALPVAVYQTYRFMRPGLYPHERRYYLAAVPFSLVLGVVGVLFAYFVILPLLFTYFITYTEGSAELAFQLADTMNLMLIVIGLLAVIFQIPLLIMLAIMMGITTRRWLARRRIYFWAGFLGLAFLFGPDPTGMAPILLAATMVVLFETTLLLLKWTGR